MPATDRIEQEKTRSGDDGCPRKLDTMTTGTALVIIMLLYLLDKYGLLRRTAVIVAILSFCALAWILGNRSYERWTAYRHKKITAALIAKYEHAIPDPLEVFKSQHRLTYGWRRISCGPCEAPFLHDRKILEFRVGAYSSFRQPQDRQNCQASRRERKVG